MICHYEKELVHSDHIFYFGSQNDIGDFCVNKNENFFLTYYLDEKRTKTSTVRVAAKIKIHKIPIIFPPEFGSFLKRNFDFLAKRSKS